MHSFKTFVLHPLVLLACSAWMTGCTVGPDYHASHDPAVQLTQSPDAALYSNTRLQQDWWRQFQDLQLDALIHQALSRNHDLRIARARLLEARAVLDQRQLDQLPTVTASGDYSRSLSQANPGPSGERNLAKTYQTALDAQWELDLFGRLQRLSESSSARAEAVAADLAQTRIVVTAEVARHYFEMRGAQRQLAVARANLRNQEKTVELVQGRVDAGRGTADELASALAERAQVQATLPGLETRQALSRYRLAVLTGSRPIDLQALTELKALPALVTRLPIGQISDLLRQRPDVASAERTLAASNADIGAVTAELYPSVDLGGFLGFVALRGGDLGDSGSRAFSVMPSVSWPALHLFSVKARQREAQARGMGSRARYEQVVLNAIEETERALTTYSLSQQRVRSLAEAASQSERAARLAHARYEAGGAKYLVELDAQRTQLKAQYTLSQAETASYLNVVQLYKALGGGWQAPEPLVSN
ncbi:efflux transporter outer membrane subunit [Pseudomonas sp. DWP1b1]|uniref:efflux transporter outer membrane subunit n=1 Tax=unclassified Pseudomonas TaxID=196821 RepID=UPI003CF057AD